jgi:hypothetical protein
MSLSWLSTSNHGLKVQQLVAVAVKCVFCHSITTLHLIQTFAQGPDVSLKSALAGLCRMKEKHGRKAEPTVKLEKGSGTKVDIDPSSYLGAMCQVLTSTHAYALFLN